MSENDWIVVDNTPCVGSAVGERIELVNGVDEPFALWWDGKRWTNREIMAEGDGDAEADDGTA